MFQGQNLHQRLSLFFSFFLFFLFFFFLTYHKKVLFSTNTITPLPFPLFFLPLLYLTSIFTRKSFNLLPLSLDYTIDFNFENRYNFRFHFKQKKLQSKPKFDIILNHQFFYKLNFMGFGFNMHVMLLKNERRV